KTVSSIGSSSPFPAGRARLHLDPGRYQLGLRYYDWRHDAELPSVSADGRDIANCVPVPSEVNEFYRTIGRHANLYYKALHYYAFILLGYRRWFPASFVEREFLPMGNPETEFYFAALRQSERLQLKIAPEALEGWDVLLTLYDKASFPTHWEQVTQTRHQIVA